MGSRRDAGGTRPPRDNPAVRVVRIERPQSFADRVRPLLLADEARHNLMLGICTTLVENPRVYEDFHLWIAERGGVPVGAATVTPPFNLAVARPLENGAIEALARAVAHARIQPPGVVGAVPEVEEFVSAWRDATRTGVRLRMAQRILRLSEVRPVSGVPGRMRPAHRRDRDILVAWIRAFGREALGEGAPATDPERVVDVRLQGRGAGLFVWEDGGPVSLAGYGGFTPNGARIGPVYTPPGHRLRGYASALTAGVSAWLLGRGRRLCFLYTDATNPTSNRIYERIGYERVCDSREYAFQPQRRRA